ncbi:MAG: diaminopimelate epimerase [Candidatus Sumerlaeota bacterium]|nr:diaminopimelate epimerase [Candidatus Sumerlaeota bacterium]
MQLKVFKYEAAGNDFAALWDPHANLPDGAPMEQLARALCDRRRGIGADGILVLRPADVPGADFRMVYHNADGSRGEMCGNGARSIARFARLMGMARDEMAFETDAGPYRASLIPGGAAVAFPPVPGLPGARPAEANGRAWQIDFLRVGVPHAVVWVEDLASLDVAANGHALRHHAAFAPAGTNVNFATPDPDDPTLVRIRTYERGVEAETLACGTGSTATALCRARRLGLSGAQTMRIVPTSGETLTIGFRLTADGAEDVTLSGPARLVFSTVLEWDPATGALLPFDAALGRKL